MSDPTHSDKDALHLYVPFRAKVEAALVQANAETKGKPFTPATFSHWGLFEGYRSVARQLYLYEQGRTRPGSKVTNMKTPKFHGFGLAADCVWYDRQGNPHWDGDVLTLWAELGHAARSQGLVWGGDWTMKDLPHLQSATAQADRPKAKAYLKTLGLTTP